MKCGATLTLYDEIIVFLNGRCQVDIAQAYIGRDDFVIIVGVIDIVA